MLQDWGKNCTSRAFATRARNLQNFEKKIKCKNRKAEFHQMIYDIEYIRSFRKMTKKGKNKKNLKGDFRKKNKKI